VTRGENSQGQSVTVSSEDVETVGRVAQFPRPSEPIASSSDTIGSCLVALDVEYADVGRKGVRIFRLDLVEGILQGETDENETIIATGNSHAKSLSAAVKPNHEGEAHL
jgi:hypothetical protein